MLDDLCAKTISDAMEKRLRLHFFAPVCPDYAKDFSLADGISESAASCMAHIRQLSGTLESANYHFNILLADTEDDLPGVLQRLTGGDLDEFTKRSERSVKKINEELGNLYPAKASAERFRSFFGNTFREQQYAIEAKIRELRRHVPDMEEEITKISFERAPKYKCILGREEVGNELTIRYMAQYGALGVILRHMFPDSNVVVMNYETPNNRYYNERIEEFLDMRGTSADISKKIAFARRKIPVFTYEK